MKLLLIICVIIQVNLASQLNAFLSFLGLGINTKEYWILWILSTAISLVTTIGGIVIYVLYPTKRD